MGDLVSIQFIEIRLVVDSVHYSVSMTLIDMIIVVPLNFTIVSRDQIS